MKNYNCQKSLKETGLFVAAIIFFALCMCVCFIGAYAVEDSGQTENKNLKILVKDVEITAKNGISGDCNAEFSGDTVSLSLDGFAYPEAYAQIKVTVYNDGTLTAILDEQQQVDCDIDGVSVSFPQLDSGEKIEPKGKCDFTVVVKWDGNSDNDCSISESGNFSLKLKYSADVADNSAPDESSSDIDDSSVTDESSSDIDDSSAPDESSSDIDESSAPDESSSDSDDSTVSEITDSDSQSNVPSQTSVSTTSQAASDTNVNTGFFTEKNLLLVLSAVFAVCTAMCAVQLYSINKNGDETDK